MKKWTEHYPRDNAIVDWKGFRTGASAHIGTLNGGMDRTTMPDGSFDRDNVVAGAFHRAYQIRRNDWSTTSYTNGSANQFRGIGYGSYGGGWTPVDEFEVTEFKDGMCHWEFSFHFHNNQEYSENNTKSITIRLLWDGVEVNHAYKIAEPIGTFRMVCDFPTTGGNHTCTVQARSVAPSDTENDENLMNLFAMNHLIIGRWR